MEQFTKTRHSVSIVNTPETVTLQKIGSFKYVSLQCDFRFALMTKGTGG